MEQFTIHINASPKSKVTFKLTYEEVLKRRLNQYNIIIKVKPKQLVQDFEVAWESQARPCLSLIYIQ